MLTHDFNNQETTSYILKTIFELTSLTNFELTSLTNAYHIQEQ
jgi:hypothetical protein